MRTFIIKPGDLIPIGRAGENQATQIRFDVTGWADTFGAGAYTLVIKRPHEDTAYPVEVTTDGDYVVWTVSNVDTGIAGNASVQLRYVVDGALAKSVIYTGIVGESLDNIVDPPDPFEDLIQRMVDLAERTEAAAESAAGSAASASESAGTATAAKTAAQTAAQAAQTAQGTATQAAQTATQAKDAAQAAQQAAEAAQSNAANSATAASGSATAAVGSAAQAAASATAADASAAAAAQSAAAAQAAAMDVIDKAPVITDTASGAIASFPDGADAPIKQLTVAVNPVQDLHGYDNPWPAGGGKNLLPTDSVYHDDSTGDVIIFSGSLTGKYTFSVDSSGVTSAVNPGAAIGRIRVDGTYQNISITNPKVTVTGEITKVYVPAANVYAQYRGTAKFQLESGSTATDWTPYSNICPITGWTGANVYNTPFTSSLELGALSDNSGAQLSANTRIRTGFIKVSNLSSINLFGSDREKLRAIHYYDASQTWLSSEYNTNGKALPVTSGFNEPENYSYIRLVYMHEDGAERESVDGKLAVVNYTTYPITWQSEAGTVYGGKVTVNQDGSADLAAEWANIASYAGEILPGEWISDRDVYAPGTTPTTGAQVVYKLATPLTYTLTAAEMTTLFGQNNWWADCGDIAEINYRCDTAKYIDKKLAALLAALS